ncbi:LLM class flavin-dependent oxidoreductase [Saccharibacillus sp. CPCC 101409]|uniref:LLM class flavin-dependent oxidoreductase n=1 Tax=Saccharibacillus sp. CPCC 101409 TaxID=3058041 RepID=UPI002672C0F9|nr:LLM class flavin-dependent oxidoreductase [Saccharibacillus sp. CPCC 101409]MDO3408253.1 LLM class flavin-dependent oxidoreductase [Saccharibacillus sp. CPCC 101409]
MKNIHLGVFEVNGINHLTQGIWAHPGQERVRYNELDYWIEIARILERGKFDFMFFADSYGYPKKGRELLLREASGTPGNDPMLLIPALAAATEHLAFTMTTSTTYEAPYANARRFSTLDHLTRGRIGWNVVTTSSSTAADLFGGGELIPHDERYDRADEYMDVSYKYWEGSWEDDAVRLDRERRVFADPDKVHQVRHEGRYFRSTGVLSSTPSPQRTPVIFQAGSSDRGREFAAKHAEGVFLKAPSVEVLAEQIRDIRRRAAEAGRDPRGIKIFTGLSAVVAPTREEAERKHDEYLSYQSREATLASYAGVTGIDLNALDPDAYFENIHTEMGRTHTDRFTKYSRTRRTVREVTDDFLRKGFRGLTVIGTPEDVADKIEEWTEAADLDGFNLEPYILPDSYSDFVDLVVPVLQERGLFRREYEPGTFRERLFGPEAPRLPDTHPGADFRPVPQRQDG